jgi:hypothetical protein
MFYTNFNLKSHLKTHQIMAGLARSETDEDGLNVSDNDSIMPSPMELPSSKKVRE